MSKPEADYAIASLLAFMMGIVRGIVTPDGRGLTGFFTAILVGVCCGFVAAVLICEFGGPTKFQYAGAALAGIIGDRVIFRVIQFSKDRDRVTNVTVHGGQNNIGDNEIRGNQNQNHE